MSIATNEQIGQLDAVDEELIDTLIAISVISKRLAKKLRNQTEKYAKGENQNE